MPFEYPDIETKPVKEPRLITRKIRFEKCSHTNEGWLVITANRLALKYGGRVLNYKIRSWADMMNMSYIKFRCPKENWLRLHCEFLGETNGKIEKVRCSRL